MNVTRGEAPLRIGIVGARSIGTTHGSALAALAGEGFPVRVVAYSGGTTQSAHDMGWPDATRRAHEEILDDASLDVVVLCSPTDLHGTQALRVASSGRHVVVEKPMSLGVAEADALIQAQERGPGIVSMISQRRHEFPYPDVRVLLRSGELGEPRLFTTHVHWYRGEEYFAQAPWRAERARGGGSLANQGVHNLDLLQWLGGPVRSVTAQVSSQMGLSDIDDTLAATLAFGSGALGVLSTSTATPPGFDATLTVHTDKGRVVLGQGEILSWEIDGVDAPIGERGPRAGSADPAAIGTRGHEESWREIIGAIHTGSVPMVDAREGGKVTRLIDAIYEADRTGRRIRIS